MALCAGFKSHHLIRLLSRGKNDTEGWQIDFVTEMLHLSSLLTHGGFRLDTQPPCVRSLRKTLANRPL